MARDSFYVYGRRIWDDGMTLEACASSRVTDTDDGGMVIEMTDDDGECAIFVLAPEPAATLRGVHEVFFAGARMLNQAIR